MKSLRGEIDQVHYREELVVQFVEDCIANLSTEPILQSLDSKLFFYQI